MFGTCSTTTPSAVRPAAPPKSIGDILLDTGASTIVITPAAGRRTSFLKARARIASGQEVDVSLVQIKSIRIGSATVDNLSVAVYELSAMDVSAKPSVTVDGFLGVDFIGRFTMTSDPRAGTLTIQSVEPTARQGSPQPDQAEVLPPDT